MTRLLLFLLAFTTFCFVEHLFSTPITGATKKFSSGKTEGQITGTVFNDLNGDSAWNQLEEPTLSGWEIIATKGIDEQRDTTDNAGNYLLIFAVEDTGTWTINIASQASWIMLSPASGNYILEVSDDVIANQNFGMYQFGSISGISFKDNNGNGIQDVSENGLQNLKMYISGSLNDSVLTDENGNYSFDSLLAGTYTISQELLASWIQLTPVSPENYSVEISSGTTASNKHFGNFQYGSISGMIFLDADANGTKDVGELGIENWEMKLDSASTDSTLSDANGNYLFNSLLAGNYVVSAKLQEGWSQTFPASPSSYSLTVSSGTTFSGKDFGVFQSSSISGMKFFDGNANGSKEEGENGIANWKILLTGDKTDSALTDANGNYTFGSLLAGNYTVSEVNQDGWQQTMPAFPGTYTVSLVTGEQATGKDFGNFTDTLKLRTFNFSVDLSKKATKLKFSKDSVLKESPNLATAVEAVFSKIGKSGATFLGIPQTDAALAKQYAWIFYKKAMDFGKLFTSRHRGLAMPLDSLRTSTKTIKLSKAIKADRKKFDNVGIEQGVLFNLNLKASELGVTPTGLGSLLLDTNVIVAGRSLQDSSLAYIGTLFDSVMTYPQEYEITNTFEYVKLSIFADSILRHFNNAFSQELADSNYRIDTNGVIVGKNPYALYLKGVRLTGEVNLLKRGVGKSASANSVFGSGDVPENFSLKQNYPNPFNPFTVIRYSLIANSRVTLKIYNVVGQEVATVLNSTMLDKGEHEIQFDASNLSSGVYFYRISINNGENSAMKKMMLLK